MYIMFYFSLIFLGSKGKIDECWSITMYMHHIAHSIHRIMRVLKTKYLAQMKSKEIIFKGKIVLTLYINKVLTYNFIHIYFTI